MPPIFHITTAVEAHAARATGVYVPEAFDREGFIHCSYAGQLTGVADARFTGRDGLVLLEIDPDRVAAT